MAASRAEALAARVRDAYEEAFGGAPRVTALGPGRANIIGEHTDYNGGFVLPFAVDRGVVVALTPRADRRVRLRSLDFDALMEVELGAAAAPLPIQRDWTGYVAGLLNELLATGAAIQGFDGVVAGDVPIGSGISSSAAFEVAIVTALDAAFALGLDRWQRVRLCQATENRWFGVHSGVMDQFASVFGGEGEALFLENRAYTWRGVPMAIEGGEWLVLQSGVSRTLAGSGYNQRRAECEGAVARLREHGRRIETLSELGLSELDAACASLSELEARRARHVVSANQRVLSAIGALQTGQIAWLGQLLRDSHRSLRDDYQVSVPQLDFLAERAMKVDGVLGARLMGAGFGGAMIVLGRPGAGARLIDALRAPYREAFDLDLEGFEVKPAPGARILEES